MNNGSWELYERSQVFQIFVMQDAANESYGSFTDQKLKEWSKAYLASTILDPTQFATLTCVTECVQALIQKWGDVQHQSLPASYQMLLDSVRNAQKSTESRKANKNNTGIEPKTGNENKRKREAYAWNSYCSEKMPTIDQNLSYAERLAIIQRMYKDSKDK